MAKQFECIEDVHRKFIKEQHLFFVGSAAAEGRVNVSPKGMDSLRVMDGNRVVWLNITGSGNETAGHLLENPRMTLMWCSFERRPLILRTYGMARAIHPRNDEWVFYRCLTLCFQWNSQWLILNSAIVVRWVLYRIGL